MLRPGSDRHGKNRGIDRRIETNLYNRYRHPFNAAGGAGFPAGGVFLLGDLVELGEMTDVFTTPQDERTQAYITGRIG